MTSYGFSDSSYTTARIVRGVDDLGADVVELIVRLRTEDPRRTPRHISDELMERDIPVLPEVVAEVLALRQF
ncbi:hypothetical protein I0C86_40505 [Plantactinospora sp. S1510]|uniref:Uncharacterized protein n=1 Tax=Plantactinospora alkalitolerans TaxID=2789879 RepID=A0ABS0H9L0_9ACTN|nr:hypothetical protein [Plantactinospora alkalitolerans]MBF9135163.1 hypothetical protein [Plantactinospora alkalitolerans]